MGTAIDEIGVKEVGTNSGRRVKQYLASCGLGEGAPWCSAFVHWNFRECGRRLEPAREFALAARWSKAHEVFRKGQEDMYWTSDLGHDWQRISMDGDCFTLYFANLKRIGHVGLIVDEEEDYVITVEGNTNSGGDREGEGVFKRKRLKDTIYRINRWTQ